MAAELKGTPQLGFDSSPLKHMRSSGTKHDCITGSSVQLIEMTCLLKLSADQLLVLQCDQENREHLKYFRNFYCFTTNHSKDQDTRV